jgi:hypothetical protein
MLSNCMQGSVFLKTHDFIKCLPVFFQIVQFLNCAFEITKPIARRASRNRINLFSSGHRFDSNMYICYIYIYIYV